MPAIGNKNIRRLLKFKTEKLDFPEGVHIGIVNKRTGKDAGMFAAYGDKSTATVSSVDVTTDLQGKGVGSYVYRKGMHALKQNNPDLKYITSDPTGDTSLQARAVWQKLQAKNCLRL